MKMAETNKNGESSIKVKECKYLSRIIAGTIIIVPQSLRSKIVGRESVEFGIDNIIYLEEMKCNLTQLPCNRNHYSDKHPIFGSSLEGYYQKLWERCPSYEPDLREHKGKRTVKDYFPCQVCMMDVRNS